MKINIEHSPQFDKNYKKRIGQNKKLVKVFIQRTELFIEKPNHPLLKDHQLIGNKNSFRSFSLGGDLRIIYFKVDDSHVIFFDIGSHNQVY
ncbi:type II toxin-antitoxin system mRNA interferase toxin, RelE/StbE family [Candidatus Shapirobacteria bacterium]|nr:type II toxin-antitoxin system mRNA interferase toxin, RelE/StbE family [Candidatus Shapirobacteria bacterium]